MNVKTINQSQLTSDCWMIQFWGSEACNKCEYLNKKDCSGKKIRRLIKQDKFPINGFPNID